MKKILVQTILFILIFSINCKCLHASEIDDYDHNDWIWGGGGISNFVYNYQKTNNISELQTAFKTAYEKLLLRADIAGEKDYLNNSPKAWLQDQVYHKFHASPIGNARAMYGMAELIYTVCSNPLLYDIPIEDNSYSENYYFKDKTLKEAADILSNYLDETIQYFDQYWENHTIGSIYSEYGVGTPGLETNSGFYRASNEDHFNTTSTNGSDWTNGEDTPYALPFNYNTQFGEVMLHLYLSYGNETYLDRVERIAHLYKELNINRNDYTIYYDFSYNYHPENSHIFYVAKFLDLCYQNDIIIKYQDMKKMADVFTTTYYLAPNLLNDDIEEWRDMARGFLYFSNFGNNEIYSIVADILNGAYYWDELDKFSQYHRVKFSAVNRVPGSNSEHAGISAGDFDGDGNDEMVIIRNFDGDFLVCDNYDNTTDIPSPFPEYTAYGSESEWVDVTTGDFNGDGVDEIAAVRNYCGSESCGMITILKLDTSTNHFEGIKEKNDLPSDISWAGIAGGDFDGDGKDEIFAVANSSNGDHNGYYMFEYEDGQIKEIESAREVGWGTGSEWVGATAGDFDGDGIFEFVALRNYDKIFRIYQLNSSDQIVGFGSLDSGDINGWIDISAGDIDGDCNDELVAVSACDNSGQNDDIGDIYIIKYESGQFKFTEKEFFRCEEDIVAIGCGNIMGTEGSKDEIFYARNYDGDILSFSYKLPVNLNLDEDYSSNQTFMEEQTDIYSHNSIIVSSDYSVESGEEKNFKSGESVIIRKGFKAKTGSNFTAKIDEELLWENYENLSCVSNKSVATDSYHSDISNEVVSPVSEDINLKKDLCMKLYPNPTNGILNIETNFDKFKLELIYSNGRLFESKKFNNKYGQINLVGKPKGLYIIRVISDKEVFNRKIIYK